MDTVFELIVENCIVKTRDIENVKSSKKTIKTIFLNGPDKIVLSTELFKKRVTYSITPPPEKYYRDENCFIRDFIKSADKKSLMKLFGKLFSNDTGIQVETVKSQMAMIIIKHSSDNEKKNILYTLPKELIRELKSFLL